MPPRPILAMAGFYGRWSPHPRTDGGWAASRCVPYRVGVISAEAWRAVIVFMQLVVPLLGALVWIVGLVMHGLGGSTAWPLRFGVFAIAVAMGTTLNLLIGVTQQQPTPTAVVNAVLSVGVPLAIVVALAMSGRRRVAGLVLLGLAVPWTVVWALYLVDVALGATWDPVFTAAMFVAGLAPVFIGAALILGGDPVYAPDPAAPAGRPGSRRPMSLGNRLVAESRYGAVGPSLVITLAATTAVSLALPTAPIAQFAVVLVAALGATELELRWIPPRVRPAMEAYHWVGRHEIEGFRSAGAGKVPVTPKGMRTWLTDVPETDLTRPYRVDVLIFLGEYAAAGSELDRMPETTPLERFRKASLADELGWRQGAPTDVERRRRLAAETGPEGDAARLLADGMVAWWTSQAELAALDPGWRTPLATFRERLGAAAAGLHATAFRTRTLFLPLLMGGCFVGLNALVR